jgi:mannose-6-phosphate isomerase-like protein (cupin superfamily)
MTVFVTDTTGAPVPDVHVKLNGPIVREGVTTREGTLKVQGLRAGDYRLHLEADGFVTLEKDFLLRGSGLELEVTLNRAPAPPKPAEPPAPAPRASAAPLPPPDANATADVLSVVDWLAKNKLERGEPRKEGIVARTPGEVASLLQVKDALCDRVHPDADEVIYVINGSAAFSSKGRMQTIETGALVLIPRGVTFTLENRGREPLWALSVLASATSRP